jgi:BirA family biotin operon repressor/biotin-[acetyl-CoA-carboxylase] ligase
MLSFVTIGIGLNVNNSPEEREPNGISIKTLINKSVSRVLILSDFIQRFSRVLNDLDADSKQCTTIIQQWKTKTSTLGRQVIIQTPGETSQGLAVDVDDSGALMLEQPDGSLKRIIYGDCFYKGHT